MRTAILASVVVLVASAWSCSTFAQDYVVEDTVMFAAAPVGGAGVVLTIASLAYLAHADPAMPRAWAITMIAGGAIELAFGVTALAALLADAENGVLEAVFYEDDQEWLGAWAALGIAFGAAHLAHGIFSLVRGQRPRREAVAFTLAPHERGASVWVSGAF